jgi:hypothetical protein
VGEQPVEADRDPEAGDQVHDHENDQVVVAERVAPQLPGDEPERQHRRDGHDSGQRAIERLVRGRLDVVRRGACRALLQYLVDGGSLQRRLNDC